MTERQPNATDTDAGLAAAIRLLGRTSVLVVGDVMLDRYVYGTVERVSPEAPVPILAIEREITMPGGAGNVVRNLTALGSAVAFISVVGDDQAGSDLTGLIGGQPNVEPWLLVQGGQITTLKTRYLSAGQHLLRADREEEFADPATAGRAAVADRARCDGGDLGHRAVGLPEGAAHRRTAGAAHRRGARGGTDGDRRSQGAGLLALRRCRHHHAEPHRSRRGRRDAGGRRGGRPSPPRRRCVSATASARWW